MKLEKQVCSIEPARRLRELGVPQESVYWHWATDVEEDGLTWWTVSGKEPRRGKRVRELSTTEHYRGKIAAFTVAELGEMLPESFKTYRFKGEWFCHHPTNAVFRRENTEADVRANMLIYLLENRAIKLPSQQ